MRVLVLSPDLFSKGGIARYARYQVRALREVFGDINVRVLNLVGPGRDPFDRTFPVSWTGPHSANLRTRCEFALRSWGGRRSHLPDLILVQHVNLLPLAVIQSIGTTREKVVANLYGHEIWSGMKWHRKMALLQADQVIADSHHGARVALELGLVPSLPNVVHDCVDLERFSPGRPRPEVLKLYGITRSNRFRLLFVGRIEESTRYKGTERLVRLLSLLPPDFEAIFAGPGSDVAHLASLGCELGVDDRLHFAGSIEERHLVDIYRSADLLYLASNVGPKQGEGLPLTPIEALACGVPVIVGNQDGSVEILAGKGGISVDPFDLTTQAAFATQLADSDVVRRVQRDGALDRASAKFGYERFKSSLLELLANP